MLYKASVSKLRECTAWCVFIIAAFMSTQSFAAAGSVKGKVEYIRTHDGVRLAHWAPPRFWFSLKGVTQAGNCPAWANGIILFVANDQQALSIALAAQASGQDLEVTYDDTVLVNSFCEAHYITIGSPAL